MANFSSNPFGRIAKPLRGGGASGVGGSQPVVPTFAGLQAQQAAQQQEGGAAGKRGSWFFNQRT